MKKSDDMGLGSYWGEVIDVLKEIIPVYDKVNSYISLGKDVEHRSRAIKGRISKGDSVLDAGSGFGNMSKTATKIIGGELKIVLYDPLPQMLKSTDRLFNEKLNCACGVFEHTPFQNEEFDIVLSGYSLRDAISLRTAISEIHRVLKKNGKWIIVDLGKPDEPLIRLGVTFYLRMILPIIAFVAGGRLGLKFATLYGTYKRWPQNKKLENLLLEKFSRVEFEKDLMGGAIMVAAYK
jgi:demethylmenaquinone methyltransferase / 2-methoxy-6-polyprenyl-1,4-benzoquinol methylase